MGTQRKPEENSGFFIFGERPRLTELHSGSPESMLDNFERQVIFWLLQINDLLSGCGFNHLYG